MIRSAALLPLLLSLPLAGAAQTVPQQPPKGSRDDSHSYAQTYGVTAEEARRRMRLQNEMDHAMLERVRTREAATFAGVWIQHQPDYRVIVAFTRDPGATLRRYTKDPLYEARLARKTQAELHADQERVSAALNKLGVAFQGGTDIKTGTLQFDILSDWELVQAAIRDGRLRLPEGAELKPPAPLKVAEPGSLPPGAPFMARTRSRGGAQMSALAMGRLVVEDGCVRLRGSPDHSMLVVWSGEYALQPAGPQGGYKVVDLFTGDSIRIGEEVAMGGGAGDHPPDPRRLQAPIPPKCKGPYFFGGGTQSRASWEEETIQREARWLSERERIPHAEAVRRLRDQRARGVPAAPPPPPPQRR